VKVAQAPETDIGVRYTRPVLLAPMEAPDGVAEATG
jgi:hypothetical protein